ncbi:hypothetical protein PsYK624_131290 [Phanerochaete sordida]|uniref:Uncharacterized protein n=1 Tax=Phanerochaete sordida TaxID=48140 RepID=A0A9P3GL00_9APHY|nr:hypothetical protein PsYK624_131290 [Phanerochaete sordida]
MIGCCSLRPRPCPSRRSDTDTMSTQKILRVGLESQPGPLPHTCCISGPHRVTDKLGGVCLDILKDPFLIICVDNQLECRCLPRRGQFLCRSDIYSNIHRLTFSSHRLCLWLSQWQNYTIQTSSSAQVRSECVTGPRRVETLEFPEQCQIRFDICQVRHVCRIT